MQRLFVIVRANFSPRRLVANALYGSGIYIGSALGSFSLFFNPVLGWRGTCAVMGGAGLLLVAALAAGGGLRGGRGEVPRRTSSVRGVVEEGAAKERAVEQQPGGAAKKEGFETVAEYHRRTGRSVSFLDSVRHLMAIPSVALLYATVVARQCAGSTIAVWRTVFFLQYYPAQFASFAVINAFGVLVFGVGASFLGGLLADLIARRAPPAVAFRAKAIVPMVGCALSVPLWAATMAAPTYGAAIACYLVLYFVAECWMGPTITLLLDLVAHPPADSRTGVTPRESLLGTANGLFNAINVVSILAPLGVASLLRAGVSLSVGLSSVVCVLMTMATVGFFLVAKSLEMPHLRLSHHGPHSQRLRPVGGVERS